MQLGGCFAGDSSVHKWMIDGKSVRYKNICEKSKYNLWNLLLFLCDGHTKNSLSMVS